MTLRTTMLNALNVVQKFCVQLNIKKTDKVLVALSGGPDSLSLLYVVNKLFNDVFVVIVNHNIQKNSSKVAGDVKKMAIKVGVKKENVFIKNISIIGKNNLEEKARIKRYEKIDEVQKQTSSKYIFFGHTMDDQAETVFLNLIRASGINALKGIPPVRGCYLRPFLSVTRMDTENICKYIKIKPYFDPMNNINSKEYDSLRVKIRKQFIPSIEKLSGMRDVKNNLYKTATELNEFYEYLNLEIDKYLTDDCKKLFTLCPIIRKGVIRKLILTNTNVSPSKLLKKHIDQVDKIVMEYSGQKEIHLPDKTSVKRVKNKLVFC